MEDKVHQKMDNYKFSFKIWWEFDLFKKKNKVLGWNPKQIIDKNITALITLQVQNFNFKRKKNSPFEHLAKAMCSKVELFFLLKLES